MNSYYKVSALAFNQSQLVSEPAKSNVIKPNFKAENDSFVKQQALKNQQLSQKQKQVEDYQKEQRKQKIKQNLSWGIGLAASTVMLIFFGKLLRDDAIAKSKAKKAEAMLEEVFEEASRELAEKRNSAGKELAEKGRTTTSNLEESLKNCTNPQIKRAVAEEYKKGPGSMSNKKIYGLQQLANVTASQPKIVDIKEAIKILDEEVIGMEKEKKQVIKFLRHRNRCIKKGIKLDKPMVISFDGPPGTAKTTLANAIAKATGMPHKEISVAGATGKAKIIGNESVYIGASWGEVADAQIEHKTSGIIYTLDEVEKAGTSDHNGKFEDTLLPMLDDRHKVHDDFLDVDIDTGDSIIILTSNEFERLSEPIKDRVGYKFKIKPYGDKLKMKIAEFKMAKAIKKYKLENDIKIDPSVYTEIVKHTSDKGGREVSENVSKIVVNISSELEEQPRKKLNINSTLINKWLTEAESM